jgi:hypothetical protein
MKEIMIKTIQDNEQRYNTVGDYYTDDAGKRIFLISDMNNWKYETLIAVHEIIESALCQARGIIDGDIDNFDIDFEKKRLTKPNIGEPGDQLDAPYFNEHQFATKVEKMLAQELDVDWEKYSRACAKLDEEFN